MNKDIVPAEIIESKILFIRGKKVILDRDIANLYHVKTKALNQAVKRNRYRFPEHFMFQLSPKEKNELVTNCDRFSALKHSSALPYAFSEYGIAMLSSVLNSRRAIQVNIQIINVFIKLKEFLSTHLELKHKIEEMEKKYDSQFKVVFDAIRRLINPPIEKPKRRIGFHVEESDRGSKRVDD